MKTILLSLLLIATAWSADTYVSLEGDDTNDGTSPETAFRTIQKGVDALQPGDTLIIGPGEYHESVYREHLGSPDAETVIRAEIPHTVILRGDVPAPPFTPLPGQPFVYQADFDQPVQAINEQDTLKILENVPSIAEVVFEPGTFYQDLEAGKIYLSTSDLQPADVHRYSFSVEQTRGGLYLLEPVRVTVEGLAATGYNSQLPLPRLHYGNSASDVNPWGIFLQRATDSTIRNCVAWLNAGGLAAHSADRGGNLIEHCVAYGNYSTQSTSGGNILIYNINHDISRYNYGYASERNGVRLYTSGTDPVGLLTRNLGWGNDSGDFQVKAGLIGEATHNVALASGGTTNDNTYHNLVGNNGKVRPEQNNIVLERYNDLDYDAEFADPVNLDFRLQSSSRFRGDGPDGIDRGPFPYEPVVTYLSPTGDDAADGLSMQTAQKSFAKALELLEPGDTLYLTGGPYMVDGELPPGDPANPIHIRGRGKALAVLQGPLSLTGQRGYRFERIAFMQAPRLSQTADIHFRNCTFVEGLVVNDSQDLQVRHSVLLQPLSLMDSTGSLLSGNIFHNADTSAIIADDESAIAWADYNSYTQADVAWQVAGWPRSAANHEAHSHELTPQFLTVDGLPVLQNGEAFHPGGPLGTSIGHYRERELYHDRPLTVEPPRLHSVSAHSANIEWWTSSPVPAVVEWGETSELENREQLTAQHAYHPGNPLRPYTSFSLTDLKPATTYHIRLSEPFESEVISFTTLAERAAPRQLFVATDGDDTNDGLSRANAFRTIGHAAAQSRPGDTVLIGGGTYFEHVRIRVTGEQGAPITFKAIPGEKVTLDGNDKRLVAAFTAQNKAHLAIDSLYFFNYQRRNVQGMIRLLRCRDIRVTRCFQDGRTAGYDPEFITGAVIDGLVVENCVVLNTWDGIGLGQATNVHIAHNVFLRPAIRSIIFSNCEDAVVRQNIIGDNLAKKQGAPLIPGTPSSFTASNNCFWLRKPESERPVFGRNGMHLREYEQGQSIEQKNLLADPQFPASAEVGAEPYFSDAMMRNIEDFPDLFTQNPEFIKRGIGLQPEVFADFHFHQASK